MARYGKREFAQFLAKQEQNCREFEKAAKKVQRTGTEPDLPEESQGGYLIAYKFSQEITDIVGRLSEKINQIIPSIIYNAENAHTTIYSITHEKGPFTPDPEKLMAFTNHIHGLEKNLSAPGIVFRDWLYNGNTVIAPGTPTKEFYDAFTAISFQICSEVSSDLIDPWDARITTARFKEKMSAEQMQDFFFLMRTTPAISTQLKMNKNYTGFVKPVSINVGSFNFSAEGFNYTVYDSMKLQYAHLGGK